MIKTHSNQPSPMASGKTKPFHLTLVHPVVGRTAKMKKYIRTWLMQPLPPAVIASLAPKDIKIDFYDDRLEKIPFDQPTDLVAISVETYTAKRAYQIASEYRQRGVPVVMGGFHATLCPDEVQQYCESIVIGEAENVFEELIDDYRHRRPKKIYKSETRPSLERANPNRQIFQGKKYLPIKLIEFARGCKFKCDFCAIQSYFKATQTHRPVELVVEEIKRVYKPGQMVFFVDDNIMSNIEQAKTFMRALIPLKIKWVSQSSINVAYDDEALLLMQQSGCLGLLVGFESLNSESLGAMNKGFNLMKGGPSAAMENFRRYKIRIYGTFVFGYDQDTLETFDSTIQWAIDNGLFIAAFNHITPFPGTPLYQRLEGEGRMTFDQWWLAEEYRYNMVPFTPSAMSAERLELACLEARKRFYGWSSIGKRAMSKIQWKNPWMFFNYWVINGMHHFDVSRRSGMPLGDETWQGSLIKA